MDQILVGVGGTFTKLGVIAIFLLANEKRSLCRIIGEDIDDGIGSLGFESHTLARVVEKHGLNGRFGHVRGTFVKDAP